LQEERFLDAFRCRAAAWKQRSHVVVEREGKATKETQMAYSITTPNDRSEAFQPPRQEVDLPQGTRGNENFQDHLQTYRGFVRCVRLFAAHALVILVLLYYFLT
jgi:hypothetical protein